MKRQHEHAGGKGDADRALHYLRLLVEMLEAVWAEEHPDRELARSVLAGSEIFPSIPGLAIGCASVVFRNTPDGKKLIQSFTWDWFEGHSLAERTAELREKVVALAREGKLLPVKQP
jgi:hypothetical protein